MNNRERFDRITAAINELVHARENLTTGSTAGTRAHVYEAERQLARLYFDAKRAAEENPEGETLDA